MRLLRRVFFVAVLACAAVTFSTTRAAAVTEFCPARLVTLQPVGAAGPNTTYAYTIGAEGSRSVSGTVLFATDEGWFKADFPQTPIVGSDTVMKAGESFKMHVFRSQMLYVRFPHPVVVFDGFVNNALAIDDGVFGWAARGSVTCVPLAGLQSKAPSENAKPTPRDAASSPPLEATVESASTIAAPGASDCNNPSTEPSMLSGVAPAFPWSERFRYNSASVEIAVALDSGGTLKDAWIVSSSGSEAIDKAALAAATQSRYQGGTALCQPAPAVMMFRAEFNPN